MVRSLLLIGTTGFWLVMMSLLVRKEFFGLAPVQQAYEVLPIHNLKLREEYRAIYLGSERVGFNFSVLELGDRNTYELRHQSYLSFLFLGQEREMLIRGKAWLDPQLNLKGFDIRISSGDYWTRMKGELSERELRLAVIGRDDETTEKTIPIPGPVLYSEALDYVWTPENLKLGRKGLLTVWNPLMINFQQIGFAVKGKEKIPVEGKDEEAFVVGYNFGGVETRTWITPEGVVARQESQTGLLLQKEPGWKIFEALREKHGRPPDLPNLFSIPASKAIADPEKLSAMSVKVDSPEGSKVIHTSRANLGGLESIPLPVPAEDPALAPFLQSTPSIEAADPAIQGTAKGIVKGETGALGASLKLMYWVHENVSPMPTVGVPRAREVLAMKRGDCNEYTVLFTALARAVGIPTKMIAGLVYQNERFFYHAWPEVYLGRWVALDPTFGQAPADATHIPLVEGDLEEQVALLNQLGKTRVFTLETR